jgi:hypothetical protein
MYAKSSRPSTFSLLSLNSVIGGNFSNQARIAARPLTAGSLGGLTTASSRNSAAQVAKSLVRAAFIAICVISSIFLRSAFGRLFPVWPSEGGNITIKPAEITASDRIVKSHLPSIKFHARIVRNHSACWKRNDFPVTFSSSIKTVSISSALTMNRFPSPRYASAIQIVRPLESTAETQPQLQRTLLISSAINSQVVFHTAEGAMLGLDFAQVSSPKNGSESGACSWGDGHANRAKP